MSKSNGNNRIGALKRLSKSSSISSINRRQLFAGNHSSAKDERDLSVTRGSPYDARQILSRPVVKSFAPTQTNVIVRQNIEEVNVDNDKMIVITGLKNMKMKDGRIVPTTPAATDINRAEKNKNIFAMGSSTFVTIRNNNNNNNNNNVNMNTNPSNEKISLTKTITNTTIRREDDEHRIQTKTTFANQVNQKVMVSVVNDKYQKAPPQSQMTSNFGRQPDPPPLIKRLHDACIQTTPPPTYASRSPIRMNNHRQLSSTNTIDDQDHTITRTIDDEFYEPPVKRTTATTRKTTTDKEQHSLSSTIVAPTGAMKRTSAGAPVPNKTTPISKPTLNTQSQSNTGTILVTNLLPSVSEEDVIELFSQLGRINEIITLSAGCLQIVYAKRESAEQAVTKYHNRLLDGQFIYVSLQQTASSHTVKPTPKVVQPTKENGSSTNASSTSMNQPLKFNTSSTTTSNKISLDPAFIRQALFYSSNDTHPVQFQVKL